MPTLEQIQGKVKQLQAQAEALIAKQADNCPRRHPKTHGRARTDERGHRRALCDEKASGPSGRRGGARVTPRSGQEPSDHDRPKKATESTLGPAKGKLPPKYRDPKTGATWSGHARPPAWIASARDRTKFLIDGASAAVSANGVSKAKTALKKTSATVGAVARKGQEQRSFASEISRSEERRDVEWTRPRAGLAGGG